MKTILVTAYAVNPYKGSEDGMGWNFILQVARHQQVIAVTRKNNRPHIDRYFSEHSELSALQLNIQFIYFDWPQWSIRWKNGALLSMVYYYLWQLTLAVWLRGKKLHIDVAHNLNFHNDWTPTFLWLLGRPLVWGPVGHHPKIPLAFLKFYGTKALVADRLLWTLKNMFWWFDVALYIGKRKASHVLCMNTEAARKLRLKTGFSILPSVASEPVLPTLSAKAGFQLLMVGRFVPLKGFDVAISSFASFYHALSDDEQQGVSLTLVGTGPAKNALQKLIAELNMTDGIYLVEWMPRHQLQSLYQTASVFLFPSHEGAGMVVAEAMSYGLPVVGWDNCGPGEFVHPDTTLRIPYGNYAASVHAFAAALKNLYASPTLLATESALALQRYQQSFNWNVRGDALAKLYAEVLAMETTEPLNQLSYAR